MPEPYFEHVRTVDRWRSSETFLDWLGRLDRESDFWMEVKSARDWEPTRPFYAVPRGKGAMKAFDEKAGYRLLRAVDHKCRSNPIFCVSGIPGTVGSGTRALWRELSPLLTGKRDFAVWPFEGRLADLLGRPTTVLAEMYPAIAYTAALAPSLPAPLIKVAKTKRPVREAALGQLCAASWIAEYGVSLPDLEAARTSEDNFDALMSAAALLRGVLTGVCLDDAGLDDAVSAGGILLTSSIDFSRPARRPKPDDLSESAYS